MLGRRCDLGCETWPDKLLYSVCLSCGEPAKRWSNVTPLPDAEAEHLLLHHKFEEFYSRRCDRLGVAVDGPLPEPELPA